MIRRRAGEKGATLLELLASMAIVAYIIGGVGTLIYQEVNGTAMAKTSVTVSREIGNAARLISQDGAMAASTNLIAGAQSTDQLTLTWVEYSEFVGLPHVASYWLEGTKLRRDYDGTVTTVAQNISEVKFTQTDRLLTVSISCNPRWWILDETVEETYRVSLRPTEDN